MFGYIKSLQEFIANLKSNKKRWYTLISVSSISGILITIYLLLTLTGHVAHKVYKSMSESYKLKVETRIEHKKVEFRKVAVALLGNEALKNAISSNNAVTMENFKKIYNDSFVANNFPSYNVDFHSLGANQATLRGSIVSAVESKNQLFGIEVLADGVFFVLLQPVIVGEKVIGIIEVKDSIHSLKQDFEGEGGNYVFLLDKKMLELISLKAKSGKYKDVSENYKVEQAAYDSKFNASIAELDEKEFKAFMEEGLNINSEFYRTYKKVTDIGGADVGLMVVGEALERKGGVVHMADDMSKEVSAIALGLIISIMLFMF